MQLVVASALSLALLASVANVLVDLYARAAIRAAVEEGARAAVAVGAAPEACELRADEALADLLPGPIGHDLRITCSVDRERAVVVGAGTLPGWGLVPDFEVRVVTEAARER